jgi:hypothetical protein
MKTDITGAALYMRVSRQAIYWAIRNNKLKAKLLDGKWAIIITDIEEYMNRRYNRHYSIQNGELLFDPNKGELSVKQAAGLLEISIQRLYYYLNKGMIPGLRKNKAWVVMDNEVEKFKSYLEVRKLPNRTKSKKKR